MANHFTADPAGKGSLLPDEIRREAHNLSANPAPNFSSVGTYGNILAVNGAAQATEQRIPLPLQHNILANYCPTQAALDGGAAILQTDVPTPKHPANTSLDFSILG